MINAEGFAASSPRSEEAVGDAPSSSRSEALRRRVRRTAVQSLGIGAFYAIVIVFFWVRSPHFITPYNIASILATAAPLGLVATGQTFAIVSGGFDLSVGGVVPLAAMVYAQTSGSLPVWMSVIATVALGAAIGFVNGLVICKVRINPLIATLGMLSITGGFAYVITNGVTQPLAKAGAGFLGDVIGQNIEYSVVVFVVLVLAALAVMRYTTFGRSIYAVGGNPEASRLAGLRVDAIGIWVYVISAAFAAFAGVMYTSQLLAASPDVGTSTALNSVAAVVLGGASLAGGVGGVGGTALGVLLLATISNGLGLLQIQSYYQTIATGAVLLVAVGFAKAREVARNAS